MIILHFERVSYLMFKFHCLQNITSVALLGSRFKIIFILFVYFN